MSFFYGLITGVALTITVAVGVFAWFAWRDYAAAHPPGQRSIGAFLRWWTTMDL